MSPEPVADGSLLALLETVLDAQQARWDRDEDICADSVLASYPALRSAPAAAAEVIYQEYLLRTGGDAPALFAQYLTRYPEYADELANLRAADDLTFGSAPAAVPLGLRFGAYELLEEIGRGGMGVVYRARQTKLGRIVAIKMMLSGTHAGEAELARFRTEAEAIACLLHPNIVQVFEVGEQDGQAYFSLEFCAGGSLEQKLAGTPLPAQEAAELLKALARAIHAAHEKGVIHRDLKPANVLLTEGGTPKITDFGLAKILDVTGQTASGAILGTPSYMSPEQASGKAAVGAAADVYALGAILYECLTGRPPFKAATPLDTLRQVVSDEPAPPTQLQSQTPRDLATICLKCLHKVPARRYASANDLADDLQRFQRGEPIQARPVGTWERGRKWARRHPTVTALTGGLVVVLLVGVVGSLWYAANLRAEHARSQKNLRQAHDAIALMIKRVTEPGEVELPEMREAREAMLEDVQELCRGLTDQEEDADPETRYYQAYVFLALGELQQRHHMLGEAEKNYGVGLPRLERVVHEFPNEPKYARDLAYFRGKLGYLYSVQGRPGPSKLVLRKAADYWESTLEVYPDGRQKLAAVYNDLAEVDSEHKEEDFSKALELLGDLLRERPDDPAIKHALAKPYYNRGVHHLEHGRRDEALADLSKAMRLLESLLRDRREYRDHLGALVNTYQALGVWYENLPEEEVYLKKALDVATEMDRLFPEVFSVEGRLASSRYLLAVCYNRIPGRAAEVELLLGPVVAFYEKQSRDRSQGPYPWYRLGETLSLLGLAQNKTKSPNTEVTLRKAVTVAEGAIRAFPDDVRCLNMLASNCSNLATRYLGQNRFKESLELYDRAGQVLTTALDKDPSATAVRNTMFSVQGNRAISLYGLGRLTEALAASHSAEEYSEPGARDAVRLQQLSATRLAIAKDLAKAGNVAGAMSEAKDLATWSNLPADAPWLLACTYSLCITAAKKDGKLAPEEKARLEEEYGAEAVKQLRRFHNAGVKNWWVWTALSQYPDLEPIRARKDFQDLRREIADGR